MKETGYTGVSYPFRINSNGGVATSTTGFNNSQHISESIEQILRTNFLERPMEGGTFFSSIDTLLFEPNNQELQNILRYNILKALEYLEPRISCENGDIQFSVETDGGVECLYAIITYRVIKYNTTSVSKINLGEVEV